MPFASSPSSTKRHRTLRGFRLAHGLSQREAADLVGVHQTEWGRYEAGLRTPRSDVAERIVKLTGVSLASLVLKARTVAALFVLGVCT